MSIIRGNFILSGVLVVRPTQTFRRVHGRNHRTCAVLLGFEIGNCVFCMFRYRSTMVTYVRVNLPRERELQFRYRCHFIQCNMEMISIRFRVQRCHGVVPRFIIRLLIVTRVNGRITRTICGQANTIITFVTVLC